VPTSSSESPVVERPLEAHEVRDLAVRGLAALGLRSLSIRIMSFAANLLLARLLTPHDFGLMAFGLTIMGLGAFITDGGLGAALLRAAAPPEQRVLAAVFGAQLVLATGAALAIVLLALPLGTLGAVAALMALALPIDCVRVPGALLSERRLDYTPIVRAEVAEMLAYNIVAVATVALGAGIWGIAAAVPVRAVVGTIVLTQQSRVLMRPRLSFAEVRPLYRFGLRLQGVGLISMARDQVVNFATTAIAGASVLGMYSFAQRLTQPIWILFEGSWRISYPAMSRLRDAGSDLVAASVRALGVASAVTGLGVVAVSSAAPAAVPALFGHKWDDAIPVLPLILASLFVGGPILACASGLFATLDEAEKLVRAELAVTIVTFAAGIPLLAVDGVVGLAAGVLAGSVTGTAYLAHALARHGVSSLPTIIRSALLTGGAGAAGWAIAVALGPSLWSMLAASVAGCALYVGLLWSLQRATARDALRLARRAVPQRMPVTDS
jgi:O-antigen/teichoic acid export membrane protein